MRNIWPHKGGYNQVSVTQTCPTCAKTKTPEMATWTRVSFSEKLNSRWKTSKRADEIRRHLKSLGCPEHKPQTYGSYPNH